MIRRSLVGTSFKIILWIGFLFSGLVAISQDMKPHQEQAKSDYQENRIYGKAEEASGVVRVYEIYKTNIAIDSNKMYIIKHDTGYSIIDADENDEDIKQILQDKDNLNHKSYYLAGEIVKETERKKVGKTRRKLVTNITEDLRWDFLLNFYMTGQDETLFNTTEYISIAAYKNQVRFNFWFGVCLLLASFITFWKLIKHIQSNRQHYNKLVTLHPQLTYQFNTVKEEASYINNKLKLLVYQDTLIYYHKRFYVEKCSDIKKISFFKDYYKGKLRGIQLLVTTQEDMEEPLIIKKLKTEKFNQFKLEFVAYITKNYKDIMIK